MAAMTTEQALAECVDVLGMCEGPASCDPAHAAEVRALGRRIGYGALMDAASALWAEELGHQGAGGGAFTVGPCRATVASTLRKAKEAIAASR